MKEIKSTYIINETMQNNIKRSMQYLIDNGVAKDKIVLVLYVILADGVVGVDNSIKCLIASGVEQDRAKIVLRTLGYTLFNAELFPEIA